MGVTPIAGLQIMLRVNQRGCADSSRARIRIRRLIEDLGSTVKNRVIPVYAQALLCRANSTGYTTVWETCAGLAIVPSIQTDTEGVNEMRLFTFHITRIRAIWARYIV